MTPAPPLDSPPQPPDRPARRTTVRRVAGAAIILTLLAAALFLAHRLSLSPAERDAEHINIERLERFARTSAGLPLRGTPDLSRLKERLADRGFALGAPVLIRIFKREFELEVWMATRAGLFERFATYPICMWSGKLGPKIKTGDYQAPEGFYVVSKAQLNPNSKYHRSFNLGFPNAFDRALGRTGSLLMVHGACASVGCYAMTDAVIGEIWTLVTAALEAGQPAFQVQAYPFRMTEENLAAYAGTPEAAFWRNLAEGNALFERTRKAPQVRSCAGRYLFTPGQSIKDPLTDGDGGDRCPEASGRS